MKTKSIILISVGIVFLLFSCKAIFNGAVLPNQCQKCEIIDRSINQVIWSIEGCGAENTELYEKSVMEAYERSRSNNNLCELQVKCKSWKKDPN